MKLPILSALAAVIVLGGPLPAALAHPGPGSSSTNIQGDQQSWINDPHMHAFYALTVAAFANGPAGVDRAKFEADASALFRDFATARGMNPDAMVDHLKLIPSQVIQIATDDPKTLASYDNFVVAVFGPSRP